MAEEMDLEFTGKVEPMSSLIEEGTYEVTLNASWDETKAGAKYIKLVYTIRKDIDQNAQGRLVFDGIYKDRETGKFPKAKIDAILSTIPTERQRLKFKNYDELMQFISGLNMKIEVETEKADPNKEGSKDRSKCKYLSQKPSDVGPTFVTDSAGVVEDTSVGKGDLPF